MKTCSKCKVSCPENGFYPDKRSKDRLAVWCIGCVKLYNKNDPRRKKSLQKYQSTEKYKNQQKKAQRKLHLKKKYSITPIQYDSMLISQCCNCAICGKNQKYLKTAMSVDHCHNTNKIRGLLCNNCNIAIGLFSDRIELLESAIKYLKLSKTEP